MLRVEDLSVAYGSVKALKGVNLEVAQRGVLHGVIGPNGAGKSTLMDAITGRRKPTRGRVFVGGRDITNLSVVQRRRLGMSRSFQRTSHRARSHGRHRHRSAPRGAGLLIRRSMNLDPAARRESPTGGGRGDGQTAPAPRLRRTLPDMPRLPTPPSADGAFGAG